MNTHKDEADALKTLGFIAVIAALLLFICISHFAREEQLESELCRGAQSDGECPKNCQEIIDYFPSNLGFPCSCYYNSKYLTYKDIPVRCIKK